ncbi:MAG: RDD family protein [Pseudomonadota bacterium]
MPDDVVKKDEIIARFAVAPPRLLLGGTVGLLLYPLLAWALFEGLSGGWEAISGRPVSPPRIAFMSAYEAPAKNGYLLFVLVSCVAIGLLSLFSASRLGTGLGHGAVGVRMLDESGAPASFGQLCKKMLANVVYFLMIALPGPVIGFGFGSGSEIMSLVALAGGIAALVYVSFRRDRSGRLVAYTFSGIVPVRAETVDDFRRAVGREPT